MDCVRKTFKWQGLGGFYTGIYSPLAGQMFFRAASFATFHYSLKNVYISNNEGILKTKNVMLAGAITGFVIAFIEVFSISIILWLFVTK